MSLQVTTIVNGPWRQNCYLLSAAHGTALIIDPGSEAERIEAQVAEQGLRPIAVVNTHGHFDHIGAVVALQARYDIPFYLHRADAALVRRANLYRLVFDGRASIQVPGDFEDLAALPPAFEVGQFCLEWLPTPGHTPGSVCLRCGDLLFTGDTLLAGGPGRHDLPGGDADALRAAVARLRALPEDCQVYAGHGPSFRLHATAKRAAPRTQPAA